MEVKLLSITPNVDTVIEQAGRTCYLSNEKITPDSSSSFISRIIKSGHESVIEHGYATFKASGYSRAMTHQLVRHRLISISQQSQRYVCSDQFDYIIPPDIISYGLESDYRKDMEYMQKCYNKYHSLNIKKEDARFVLPNACTSSFVISANFREWRHIIKMRCDKKAQWEIRDFAHKVLDILKDYSVCFDDLKF